MKQKQYSNKFHNQTNLQVESTRTQKVLIFLGIFLFFTAFVAERIAIIKLTEDQINFHWQNLNTTKQIVNKSTIPHNEAVFVISSIDSLQKDISTNIKIDSTSKK